MQDDSFIEGLLEFIDSSPTPFHATAKIAETLEQNGFRKLDEAGTWTCRADGDSQGRYYVTRNDSSIIAFCLGSDAGDSGFRAVGAHTDSPCLRVMPKPEKVTNRFFQLGVEVYGGALLHPWFDRDLSLAGRISYLDGAGNICSALVDFDQAIATIPSLAIHLDREANENHSVDRHKHLPPVLMKLPEANAGSQPALRTVLLEWMQQQRPEGDAREVLDYELSFYDSQPAAVIGLHRDFVAAARLDNLLSCYTGMCALLDEDGSNNCVLVCNDHEEVGSMSAAGAQGPFLKSVLERLCPGAEPLARAVDRSVLISADNAHGIHPNFADLHDENHGPVLNEGPVIKVNASQRYATNSNTAAMFRQLCRRADVPVQVFVSRPDLGCGSTIGPLTAAEVGIDTIDVGVPTFAMHSIRELAGRWDAYYLYRALREFYRS